MGRYTFLEIGGDTKNGGDELRMGGMKVVAHYDQFRKDEPLVGKLSAKSDNAGCYSGNFQAESMHNQ